MAFEDTTDLFMTLDGDMKLGPDGDLMMASSIERLSQDIHRRMMTDPPGWRMHPMLGAGLVRYVGEPNTRALASAVANDVRNALSRDNLLPSNSFSVRVVPSSYDGVVLDVLANIFPDRRMTISYQFDYVTGAMATIGERTEQTLVRPPDLGRRGAPYAVTTPNKYRSRNL